MKKNMGFTLIELLLVILIIAMLTGVAVPALNSTKKQHRFPGALRDVLLMLRQARLVAVDENETVVVDVDVANGSYKAFVDDGAGSVDGDLNGILDDAKNDTQEAGERTILEGSVPDGVTITSANFSGSTIFRYDSRGFPIDAGGILTDGTITLANDEGRTRQISLMRSGHSVIQ